MPYSQERMRLPEPTWLRSSMAGGAERCGDLRDLAGEHLILSYPSTAFFLELHPPRRAVAHLNLNDPPEYHTVRVYPKTKECYGIDLYD